MRTTNNEIDISLSSKKHKLFGNQSFFVLTIKSQNYKKFHYQVASIVNNDQEIDLNKIKNELKNLVELPSTANNLIFNKKNDFLKFLVTLHFNPIATKIIEIKNKKEHCFILNQNQAKAEQEIDKNLSKVYIIDSFQYNNDSFHLAILKPIDVNNNPSFSMAILTTDKEKNPISLFSLSDNQELLNNKNIHDINKNLPYLQIISKEIIRLTNDNRESAKEKIKIFLDIFNLIRENKPQECIIAKLTEVKPTLSEHRDILSYFFNYFIKKIETRSERAVENLRTLFLAQKEIQSPRISPSNQSR